MFTTFIGLRHEIGGDWFNYLPFLSRTEGLSLTEVTAWGDPLYNAINWIFAPYTWGIYAVNTVCAFIFSLGLVFFCSKQPRPWLALTIAIPYLVIVVAIGYTRQALALGIMMPGLTYLERGSLKPFVLCTALAATVHSTAIAMLASILPAVPGRTIIGRLTQAFIVILVAVALGHTFLLSKTEQFVSGYVTKTYQSDGALVRLLMNLVPSALLLFIPKRLGFNSSQYRLWHSFALSSIACFIAFLLFPSNSTAIDRLALYFIPLQLVVFNRIPSSRLFGQNPSTLLLFTLLYAVSIQFVWLNFASHSYLWLPYQSYFFK